MKIFRGIAYGLVALCALLCIVILNYKGGKNRGDEATVSAGAEPVSSAYGVVEDNKVEPEDIFEAASAIVSGVAGDIKDALASPGKDVSENNTGEIDYDVIVSLQEKEAEEAFRKTISDYNKENGISFSSTSASASFETSTPVYDFVVNKSKGVIHRTGCILAPLEGDASYYETVKDAKEAGYTDKCTVCSP